MPLATQALDISMPPDAPGGQALLQVPQVYQHASEWCWAACMQMVENYYGVPVDQCQIVNHVLGLNDCCTVPLADPTCNQALPPQNVVQAYAECGLNAAFTQSIALQLLVNEIGSGRPVLAGLVANLGGGHAAIVCGTGMGPQGPVLKVNDPLKGEGAVYYENLVQAYGLGRWVYTWYLITKR